MTPFEVFRAAFFPPPYRAAQLDLVDMEPAERKRLSSALAADERIMAHWVPGTGSNVNLQQCLVAVNLSVLNQAPMRTPHVAFVAWRDSGAPLRSEYLARALRESSSPIPDVVSVLGTAMVVLELHAQSGHPLAAWGLPYDVACLVLRRTRELAEFELTPTLMRTLLAEVLEEDAARPDLVPAAIALFRARAASWGGEEPLGTTV